MNSNGFKRLKKSSSIVISIFNEYTVSDKFFKNVCDRLFNIDINNDLIVKNSRLNKGGKADLIRYGNEKYINDFKSKGYMSLNKFADVYRKEVKLSYNTLYKRIFIFNSSIAQYLIDKEYIVTYRKTNKNGEISKRLYTIVNYEKYEEFINCINENFLNDKQKEQEI